jgi:hypothetical protein
MTEYWMISLVKMEVLVYVIAKVGVIYFMINKL